MKIFYSKLFIVLLFAFISTMGMRAQSTFVDLTYPEDLTFSYNDVDKVVLKVVNKVALPVALPDVGVQTENVLKMESSELAEGWQDWYNGIVVFDNKPEISGTNNLLNVLVYSNNTDIQILLKGEDLQPIYHWRKGLIANQWNTITIDLSDPYFEGAKIGSIEFAPVENNVEAYVFPYWGKAVASTPEKLVPVYENLLDSAGIYHFTTNSWITDPYKMDIVPLTSELKTGLPSDLDVDNIFKLTSRKMEEGEVWTWWWVYTWSFNPGNYIQVEKGKSVMKFFVKSPNDKFVLVMKNPAGSVEWYHSTNVYTVVPNEWTEIHLDYTGRAGTGVELANFELATYTEDASVYICPVWAKKDATSSIQGPKNISNDMPYLDNGNIVVKNESDIRLYNISGQLVKSVYGTSIPAIKGLNIVIINGTGYKLLNSK